MIKLGFQLHFRYKIVALFFFFFTFSPLACLNNFVWVPDPVLNEWNSILQWVPIGSVPNGTEDIANFVPFNELILNYQVPSISLSGINPTVNRLHFQGGWKTGSGTKANGYQIQSNGTITLGGTNPEIILTNSSEHWRQVTHIEGPVVIGGATTISVGPYTGTYRNLQISGSITGGGAITKLGAADLAINGTTLESSIALDDGNLIINGLTTLNTVISGVGNVAKKGTTTLTIEEDQTYTGTTILNSDTTLILNGGSIATSSAVSIGDGSTFTIQSGAGNKTIQNLSGSGTLNLNDNQLTINVSASSSTVYQGVIEGATGSLVVTGGSADAELWLQGANTFTGATTINSGTIILAGDGILSASSGVEVNAFFDIFGDKSIQDLSGSGTVGLEGNTLTITEGGSTFSGTLTNGFNFTGNLAKTGSSTSTLSGNNTFTGTMTVSNGGLTLSGTNAYTGATFVDTNGTLTLSGSGSIANSGSVLVYGTLVTTSSANTSVKNLSGSGNLTLNSGTTLEVNEESVNGALLGTLSGSGNLTKTGSMSFTLSGTSPSYTGTSTINAGTLILTGTLGGPGTVGENGTLKGNGQIGAVTNSGIVYPGTSIGTLDVDGIYTQESTGNLTIEIAPTTSSRLAATGIATLAGSVTISPLPGIYQPGTNYTILTGSSVSNTFSSLIELQGAQGLLIYSTPGSVIYSLTQYLHVLPVPVQDLRGNAARIAKYLFNNSQIPANSDLDAVYQTLLTQSISNFPWALQKVGPTQFGALPLVSLQSDVRVAEAFIGNCRQYANCQYCKKLHQNEMKRGVWVQPLVFDYTQRVYRQEDLQQQIKFNSITYGGIGGVTVPVSTKFLVSGGVGYTQSNIHWEKQAGNARCSTLYLGPAVTWNFDPFPAYAEAVILQAVNFYHVRRRIVFPGLNRVAKNIHTSFDTLLRLEGGMKYTFKHFFLEPQAVLNSLVIVETEYTEEGANSLNLKVYNKNHVYLRPKAQLTAGFELCSKKMTYIPSVHLGWVSDIPLTNGFMHSRLRNQFFPDGNQFPVLSFHRTTNQLVVGAEFNIKKDQFCFNATFDANYLDKSMVQEGKFKFEWYF